jgi:membrane associated rhomboid family serine protease
MRLINSFIFPFIFLSLMWLLMIYQSLFHVSLVELGVLPRHLTGLIGIITMPLIHANYMHLASNSIPLITLGAGIIFFYPEVAGWVWGIIYFFTGALVWIFARESEHIGASGLIYGFAAFLFFGGIFRKNTRLLAISLLVMVYYGSMIWGVLPVDPHISWEGHLFGAFTGLIAAWIFKNKGPKPKKYEWENEIEQDDGLPHISKYFEVNP